MAYFCYKCRNELEFIVKVGIIVGRNDTCPHCSSDLHCCKNCRFYDPDRHNECRIPEADFIRDREAANFCHQYEIMVRDEAPEVDTSEQNARDKLNDLFKNLK